MSYEVAFLPFRSGSGSLRLSLCALQVKDALLLAISEEYVEGVEILLLHEEQHHVPGTPHSWEAVDSVSASYTPDVTPLILAAHKNNYEILKILLDRGAKVPQPHNLRCRQEQFNQARADRSSTRSMCTIR